MALIIVAGLALIGGIGLLPKPGGILGIVSAVLLGGITPFVHRNWQRSQKAADRAKPARHCDTSPVEYTGWNGTIHTFYFSCREFADRFRAANLRKVVGR